MVLKRCDRDHTISKKIREVSHRRIPLIAIVGEQESLDQTLNLRRLGIKDQQTMTLAQLEAQFANLEGHHA